MQYIKSQTTFQKAQVTYVHIETQQDGEPEVSPWVKRTTPILSGNKPLAIRLAVCRESWRIGQNVYPKRQAGRPPHEADEHQVDLYIEGKKEKLNQKQIGRRKCQSIEPFLLMFIIMINQVSK